MFIRITLFTMLLLLCQMTYAAGTMELIEEAYELDASSITLPDKVGRSVFVRACTTCPGQRHTLVESTRFFVNGEEVSLSNIKKAMSSEPSAYLGVAYSVKDKNLTWVKLISRDSQESKNVR
jgi:hypothetical protein